MEGEDAESGASCLLGGVSRVMGLEDGRAPIVAPRKRARLCEYWP